MEISGFSPTFQKLSAIAGCCQFQGQDRIRRLPSLNSININTSDMVDVTLIIFRTLLSIFIDAFVVGTCSNKF